MRVYVSAASGYIGSHVVRALAARGHTVVTHRPFDILIHLRALIHASESFERPIAYWQRNVGETLSMLAAAKAEGAHFVFASSAAAANPLSPYGHTKAAAEQAIADSGVPATILRLFNVAGVGEGMPPEDHGARCHLIPLLLRNTGARVQLYHYGQQMRDYVHVEDVAAAFVAVAELTPGPFRIYEVGTGHGSSSHHIAMSTPQPRALVTEVPDIRTGDCDILVSSPSTWLPDWRPSRDLAACITSQWAAMERVRVAATVIQGP